LPTTILDCKLHPCPLFLEPEMDRIKTEDSPSVNSDFIAKVRELLRNRPTPLTLDTIAGMIDVSPQWLSTFLAGKIANPGCRQMVALYNLLSETPLRF